MTDIKEGETVLFKKWETEDVTFDGEKYTIIKEDSILAIID